MLNLIVKPLWHAGRARPLSMGAVLLARPRKADLTVENRGPLHEGASGTKRRGRKAAKKAPPPTLGQQIKQAKAGLSTEAKQAYESRAPGPLALFVRDFLAQNQTSGAATERLAEAVREWKQLGQSEKSNYAQKAEQNRAELQELASGLSESESQALIHVRNLQNKAKAQRTEKDGKPRSMDRRTFGTKSSRPTSAYNDFVSQHLKDSEVQQLPFTERLKRVAQMWHEQK